MRRSRTSNRHLTEPKKRNRSRELESAAKRKKMESYVDVSKDNGGYDKLTFITKDGEYCLYTSHMQLPSLFNDSDQDEDMTLRLMKERRTRFEYNNLDDEKSQFYQFI